MSAEAALRAVLLTTPFRAQPDSSGAVAIVSTNALTAMSAVARAQDATAPADDAVATGSQAEGDDENIVVTGSRIPKPELETANPVQAVTAQQIEQSGQTNIVDIINTIPALTGSITSQITANLGSSVFGIQGINVLDLRNLGPHRTLVLINGRRHVSGDLVGGGVDIGSIPVDLIERVDVLTGGTSAIYGADAVAGVVNFVMKRNFDGIRARGQIGVGSHGGKGERFGSILAGKNFADDRGNIAVAYEYSHSDRLPITARIAERDFRSLVVNMQDVPDNPSAFDRILIADPRFLDRSNDGAVDIGGSIVNGVFVPGVFDGIPEFTGSGTPYDLGFRIPPTGFTIGGSSTPLFGADGDVLPKQVRHTVNLLTSFEFDPAFRLFAEGKYSHSNWFTYTQPTNATNIFLQPDNFFLRQRFGNLAPLGARVTNFNSFKERRSREATRETYRGVIGAEGKLTDHLKYEVSYVYGRSDSTFARNKEIVTERRNAALDVVAHPVTGQPVCRITLNPPATNPATFLPSQCVPLNILGLGVASPEAQEFVTADLESHMKLTQHVVSGHLLGDLGFLFELPGGPISFAVGAEYRKEKGLSRRHDFEIRGLAGGGPFLGTKGEYDVKEAFAEIRLPLLRDLPFAHLLEFGGAVRFSDYSTAGHTTAWKVDGVYAPIPDISFRGTYAQAVRAPNIQELFAPAQQTFLSISDPCTVSNRNNGTQFRVANCTAQLTAAGLTPAQIATFGSRALPQLPGTTSGNPNLIEETAKTWTAGVVLTPRFLPGFSATFDWYDVQLKDAIFTPGTLVIPSCVDEPTLDNPFCTLFTRQPAATATPESPAGVINNFFVSPINANTSTVRGAEMTLNYRFTPSPSVGTFTLRAVAGYLKDLQNRAINETVAFENAQFQYRAEWSGFLDLTWDKGPLTVNYGLSWQSKTRRFSKQTIAAQPDFSDPDLFWFSERWTHDIYAAYDINDRFTIYGGINDFMDQKPDPDVRVPDYTYPGTSRGRFFFVGAKINLKDAADLF